MVLAPQKVFFDIANSPQHFSFNYTQGTVPMTTSVPGTV